MENEKWDIIAKKLANEELSGEEMAILENLKSDGESAKIINQAAEVIDKTDLYFNSKKFDTDKAWQKVNIQLAPAGRSFSLKWAYRVAAVMLLLITTGLSIWQFSSKNEGINEFATLDNDLSKPELLLPDGTKVILNHGSKLTYPKEFTGNTREIALSGEAFFDVTPDAKKPFIIKTNSASVKVLGTSFNVYAYSNIPMVEVVVKTGKVELIQNQKSNQEATDKVMLLPGEKGVFDKLNKKISKEAVANNNNLSWMTQEIEFNETPLGEVISTLNRAFGTEVEVDGKVDMNLHISATFDHQKPEYIMDVVALTLNLDIEKKGDNHYSVKNNN